MWALWVFVKVVSTATLIVSVTWLAVVLTAMLADGIARKMGW